MTKITIRYEKYSYVEGKGVGNGTFCEIHETTYLTYSQIEPPEDINDPNVSRRFDRLRYSILDYLAENIKQGKIPNFKETTEII